MKQHIIVRAQPGLPLPVSIFSMFFIMYDAQHINIVLLYLALACMGNMCVCVCVKGKKKNTLFIYSI